MSEAPAIQFTLPGTVAPARPELQARVRGTPEPHKLGQGGSTPPPATHPEKVESRKHKADAPAAALQEYQVGGEAWRCARFDLLAAEFTITPDQLALFHGVLSAQDRGWLMVRRLYGLQPVLPPATMPGDDLRTWSRAELRAALGIRPAQLQQELDALRGQWLGLVGPKPAPDPEAPASPAAPAAPKQDLFEPDPRLLAYDLPVTFESRAEHDWFVKRVGDYEKILQDRLARGLAVNALMMELSMRRLDCYLNNDKLCHVGREDWRAHTKLRQDLDGNYQKQIEQIKKLCPWAGAVAGDYAFAGVMSDVTKAIHDYESRGDTRLIDGIFTATEILIECRRSGQASAPRYRAGLVLFANAARAGLFDPRWQSPFQPAALKKIDLAWQAACVAASEGERLPDLVADGPAGEFDPLMPNDDLGTKL